MNSCFIVLIQRQASTVEIHEHKRTFFNIQTLHGQEATFKKSSEVSSTRPTAPLLIKALSISPAVVIPLASPAETTGQST